MAEEVLPSFNAQLRALKRGESLARVERYDIDDPPSEGMNEVLARLRRTVNAAVSRIRDATGSNFRVESGILTTNDNLGMVASVIVTKN